MRYKVVNIYEKITLNGWVVLPENWEDKFEESDLGREFLNPEDHFEDSESEIDDEYTIELNEQDAKENLYNTVD